MLAGKLQDAGLFLGWRQQDEHHEAILFQGLNDWLLQQAGGSWDHPMPVRDLIDNPEARAVAVSYLRYSMRTPRAVSYLGPTSYLRIRDVADSSVPWGWKDPRSSFTLPLWLDVFPDAKIVHVMRHGVDVARSLQVRSEAIVATSRQRFERKKWQYSLWGKRSGFTRGLRFSSLEDGVALWDDYTTEARRHVAELGDRAHELHYESFLREPVDCMAELMAFCGLGAPTPSLRASLATVDARRARAYETDPDLAALAHREQERLTRHGY